MIIDPKSAGGADTVPPKKNHSSDQSPVMAQNMEVCKWEIWNMVSDQMTSAKLARGNEYLVSRDSSSQGDHILFQKEFRAFFHLVKQPKLTLVLGQARERPSNNISSLL